MLPMVLSAILLTLTLAAFIFGIYYSVKKRKSGGCSGCSGCSSADKCNQRND